MTRLLAAPSVDALVDPTGSELAAPTPASTTDLVAVTLTVRDCRGNWRCEEVLMLVHSFAAAKLLDSMKGSRGNHGTRSQKELSPLELSSS